MHTFIAITENLTESPTFVFLPLEMTPFQLRLLGIERPFRRLRRRQRHLSTEWAGNYGPALREDILSNVEILAPDNLCCVSIFQLRPILLRFTL